MQFKDLLAKTADKRFQVLAGIVILLGITFRLIMFFQNRNLIIDEANVVRNIYERSFIALLKPLSYEQYAPPLYLWSLEIFSFLFGYTEMAMRLTALLCGIGALFAFRELLRKIMPDHSAWLPLGLLCFAPILVKYSAEVKQYGPDSFVAIMLVLTALKMDLMQMRLRKFCLGWMLFGSLAVWASQPSVFILASVGFYYFIQCIQQKKWNLVPALALIGGVWLAQFGVYYELILKAQINSGYLQNYHHDYFLYALPSNKEEWMHNWVRIKEIMNNTVGYNMYSFYAGLALAVIGALALLRKSASLFALLVLPLIITLIAAALNQFSLIERVVLFILPFTMLLVGYGFYQFVALRFKIVQVAFILLGIYVLKEYNLRSLFYERFVFQELTPGLDYIVWKGGRSNEVFVDCASRDTYIYYTQIHPEKGKYAQIQDAYLFRWDEDDFQGVASKIPAQNAYFVFTGGSQEQRERHVNEVKQVLNQTDLFTFAYCYVFAFQKK